jgi:hypothetical protein
MDREEMGNLLSRIDERQDAMAKDMAKFANGIGFPRCAEHKAKVEDLRGTVNWLRSTFVGGVLVGLFTFVIRAYTL